MTAVPRVGVYDYTNPSQVVSEVILKLSKYNLINAFFKNRFHFQVFSNHQSDRISYTSSIQICRRIPDKLEELIPWLV